MGYNARQKGRKQTTVIDSTYSFGYWVKRRRRALDLTQRALAGCVGCAVVTIKKIEADERRPSRIIAARLADCLAVEPHERGRFLAMALGEQPGDTLALARQPIFTLADTIPQATTPFLGRETECATLLAMLAQPEIRLISVVGPGGIGKTRLVLAAAGALRQQQPRPFADGILFVDLTAAADPDSFLPVLARTLRFPLDSSGQEPRSFGEQLIDFLGGKAALLILDNFEHLLPIVPWLESLLRQAPRLTILTTSRERLGLYSEHVYPLQPMHYPHAATGPETAVQYDAVKLFAAAARRVLPDFALTAANSTAVVNICRLVSGMPLALELAAGWADTLPPAAIAAELQAGLSILESERHFLAARHRNMRAILAASWQRLPEEAQAVFARLCLFPGGCTRASAAAVAGATLGDLATFNSRSMLTADLQRERYYIHDLLRQFGLEQLESRADGPAARESWLAYFLNLTETADAHLRRRGQEPWLALLDDEADNLQAVLAWALSQPAFSATAVRIVLGLCWYWRIRSRPAVAYRYLSKAIAVCSPDPALLAMLHLHAGHMLWMCGDNSRAADHLDTSQSCWHEVRAAGLPGSAYTRHAQAMLAATRGEHAQAVEQFSECINLFERSQDAWGLAFALGWRGNVTQSLGNPAQAVADLSSGIAQLERLGDDWMRGLFLGAVARIELQNGRVDQAEAILLEVQDLAPAWTHWHSMGERQQILGGIALHRGNVSLAREHYTSARMLYEDLGNLRLASSMQATLDALPTTNAGAAASPHAS